MRRLVLFVARRFGYSRAYALTVSCVRVLGHDHPWTLAALDGMLDAGVT